MSTINIGPDISTLLTGSVLDLDAACVVSDHQNLWSYYEPEDGFDYTPVLVHLVLNINTEPNIAVILNHLAELMSDMPPFGILVTNGHSIKNFIDTQCDAEYMRDTYDTIISMDTNTTSLYETLNDNLPADLVDALSTFDLLKLPDSGSLEAETLSATTDIPCISMGVEDVSTAMLSALPTCEGWHYVDGIKLPAPSDNNGQGTATEDGAPHRAKCSCCGKRRDGTKFFYSVQAEVCPKCETRIKELSKNGKVNVLAWATARMVLEQERKRTRLSNMLYNTPKLKTEVKCPRCGHATTAIVDKHTRRCNECHKDFFLDYDTRREAFIEHGQQFNVEWGTQKLLSVTPAYYDNFVKTCWSCGRNTADYASYTSTSDEGLDYILCKDCNENLKTQIAR